MRARDLGLFADEPTGPHNAITDVAGVRVGHVTLISDEPAVVRTGVTAIVPREDVFHRKVTAAVHVINGYGKATGLVQIEETGYIETPIVLTNTLCVGRAVDGLIGYMLEEVPGIGEELGTVNPVVAECNDGYLNQARYRAVEPGHVAEAVRRARSGPVEEGSVGAGTGMTSFRFKSGIGTASRKLGEHTLGVLVLANFGRRRDLTIAGVPVGRELDEGRDRADDGSAVVILATDAPCEFRLLGRVARRAVAGLVRTGSALAHGSGDFVIAFSTRAPRPLDEAGELVEGLFRAAAAATEEAVLNSLLAARDMTGYRGRTVPALPLQETVRLLEKYGRGQGGPQDFWSPAGDA